VESLGGDGDTWILSYHLHFLPMYMHCRLKTFYAPLKENHFSSMVTVTDELTTD
jgi:hypothetical protein